MSSLDLYWAPSEGGGARYEPGISPTTPSPWRPEPPNTLSKSVGGLKGFGRGRSPGFMRGWPTMLARLSVSSERP